MLIRLNFKFSNYYWCMFHIYFFFHADPGFIYNFHDFIIHTLF